MDNRFIENAKIWATKLGFSEDWLLEMDNYSREAEEIPFDPKNKELFKRKDMMLNLVNYLNYCDIAKKFYEDNNLPEDILMATLLDIKIWAYRYKEVFGHYGVKEIVWLHNNIECNLFRIGRLQYRFGKSRIFSIKQKMKMKEDILEIHIPRGDKLTFAECEESFKGAKSFFPKYFPNYKYRHLTCGSWMLDKKVLPTMLPETSNIILFQNAFDIIIHVPTYDCIRFVFGETTNKRNIKNYSPKSSFQKKMIEHITAKKQCFVGYGVLKKEYR